MRQRIVIWGQNESDEKILVAAALDPAANKVITTVFPADSITEDFVNSMMKSWRSGADIPFPLGYIQFEKELTVSEPMIPEHIKVERDDVVKRAQTEWNFAVLSHRMFESFSGELDDLVEKVQQIEQFEQSVWEQLKGYWTKVQRQMREKNLLRNHGDVLRSRTNELFDQLKALRKIKDQEFKALSEKNRERIQNAINDIDERVEKGLSLQPLFEELKRVQREMKGLDFTRDHRDKTWKKLDKLFKKIKQKRFGDKAANTNSPLQRLERRYNGLLHAIEKMEKSIGRDQSDLDYQNKKVGHSEGQLEAEMRKAKIKMIEERINSKSEKLKDMFKTKSTLESRMEKERAKEERRKEEQRIAEEKEKLKQKVKEEIATPDVDSDEAAKLSEAAKAINVARSGKKQAPKTTAATVTSVGPSMNVMDAASAVAGIYRAGIPVSEEEE